VSTAVAFPLPCFAADDEDDVELHHVGSLEDHRCPWYAAMPPLPSGGNTPQLL
jgi:hypothetical protein